MSTAAVTSVEESDRSEAAAPGRVKQTRKKRNDLKDEQSRRLGGGVDEMLVYLFFQLQKKNTKTIDVIH